MAGLLAILIRWLLGSSPELAETWYASGLFPIIRGFLDRTLLQFPFPTVYVFLLGLVGLLFFVVRQALIKKKCIPGSILLVFRGIVNVFGWIVFSFFFLWGFNYYRIPLYSQLSLTPEPLSLVLTLEEMKLTESGLRSLRSEIAADSMPLAYSENFRTWENRLKMEMKSVLTALNYPMPGHPTVKPLYPAGFMRRMGIFGIYFPFTGEGYLDPSLHPIEKVFTLAHELAHGFGVTDEGEANFVAWLVCSQSSDVFLRYAGELKLFRYQLNDLFRMDRDAYEQFIAAMATDIRMDIREIQQHNLEILPYFRELSRRSNDLYLKSQGIKAGVKSYAQLPMLARAWRINSGKQDPP